MKESQKRSKTRRGVNQQEGPEQYTLDIDAGTLMLIVSAVILLPLLLTGFISH